MCTKKVLLDEDSNKFKCISCGDAVVTPSQRYFFHCTFIDYTGKINAQISADIGGLKLATDLYCIRRKNALQDTQGT